MKEDDVKRIIKTPAVLHAFDRATLSKMPREVKALYDAEDIEYNRYSQHTQQMVEKGEAKARAEAKAGLLRAACAMKKRGKMTNAEIADDLGLSPAEVNDAGEDDQEPN